MSGGSSETSAVGKMTLTDAVNSVYFEMRFSQRDSLSPSEDPAFSHALLRHLQHICARNK